VSTSVAVVGASGRLGSVVVDVISTMPDFVLHASLGSQSDLSELAGADIVVDVSTPAASEGIVTAALEAGAKVLVGTSGWSADRLDALGKTLSNTPEAAVMVVPNFSVGSVVGVALAKVAARFFDSVEIVETHHQHKIDSPSGTARATAEQIAQVRAPRGGVVAPHTNQTARGEEIAGIPVHSLRLAGVVAKQEVIFGGVAETLTISHDTQSSEAYRFGIRLALEALRDQTGLVVGLHHALEFGGDAS
jgi:4-hydroxy-tetrahydrodipicolinate reductase